MTEHHGQREPVSALFTDFYELTMLQAYWRRGMSGRAIFSLYYRTLPKTRNYLLACGLEHVLDALEGFAFSPEDIAYLRGLDRFRPDFLDWLRDLRFTGDVWAVREGTPVFPQEPILEIEAPIAEAQLLETVVMNQINVSMLIASKAARVVNAAEGRPVVDFGARRAHGIDAANKAARAAYIAGCVATSNTLAGRLFGLPVSGTMAHAFVSAAPSEYEAFETFVDLYPGTVLLVDTYDTLEGVDTVIRLAEHRGRLDASAIRIDSGDLDGQSREARRRLDAAGLEGVKIFASGGLDEYKIEALVMAGAPIDAFGVGTAVTSSSDAAEVDVSYKLSAYEGIDRVKLSVGKRHLGGPKQIFRRTLDGLYAGDVLAARDETLEGVPLLEPVMKDGVRLPAGRRDLEEIRRHTADALAALPGSLKALTAAAPYEVAVSPVLEARSLAAAERAIAADRAALGETG